MKFGKDEQETVIVFDAEIGEWEIYSCVPEHIKMVLKNTAINSADIEVLTQFEGKATSIRFTLENAAISLASFFKKKRIHQAPSEAQLQARQKFAEMAKGRSTSNEVPQ
jgi:hypothetical protein